MPLVPQHAQGTVPVFDIGNQCHQYNGAATEADQPRSTEILSELLAS